MDKVFGLAEEAAGAVQGYREYSAVIMEGLKRCIISNLPPRYPVEERAEIFVLPLKETPPTE